MKTKGLVGWVRNWFAPKNNWDMRSPSSWWPIISSYVTPSGTRVDEESALKSTALQAGIRAISETLATLPCNLMEQIDSRTTRRATDHPVYQLVHNQPNPEQDSMLFTDSMTAWLIGWGNCYAEIQRDMSGAIVALWPIHPSRIPTSNICRNPDDWHSVTVGQPGELIYYVRNDDNTETPIPAWNMLHIAGPLSKNGITGRGLIALGANAIGIGLATEEHAGAFFRNGAMPNIALKSAKVVGKETADRLRQQWQQVFGGVGNHYKALLLEEGITADPFMIDPEHSQLLACRQFSVTEIARLLRLPPHMLADLSRSTNNNVEQQAQEYISYSLQPWITRWEKAMYRQLLTPKEQQTHYFKFNMGALLRGDAASRASFYRTMVELGVFSVNDVRELEDRNPVPGGDVRRIVGTDAGQPAGASRAIANGKAAANGLSRILSH